MKRFKDNLKKAYPNFYAISSKKSSGEFRFDTNRAEYEALYLPFFKVPSSWGLGEGVVARCAKKVRGRDLRVWTSDFAAMKDENSPGTHTFEEQVPSTSWGAD